VTTVHSNLFSFNHRQLDETVGPVSSCSDIIHLLVGAVALYYRAFFSTSLI